MKDKDKILTLHPLILVVLRSLNILESHTSDMDAFLVFVKLIFVTLTSIVMMYFCCSTFAICNAEYPS